MSIESEDTAVLEAALQVIDGTEDEGIMDVYSTDDGAFREDPDATDTDPREIPPGDKFPRAGMVVWTASREEISDELNNR